MASGKSMIMAIRLVLKGESLDSDSRKAQSAVKDLDKAVQDSNKNQVSGAKDVQGQARLTQKEILALAQEYKNSGMTSEQAFAKINKDLKEARTNTKATADDVKKLGDVSLTAGTQSSKGFDLFGGKLKEIGKGLAAGAIVAGVTAITAAVVDLVRGANQAYQDLIGSTRAVDQVFKESSQQVQQFAQTAADRLGLAQAAYQRMAVDVGQSLQALGVPMQDLSQKTDELITRSRDMATAWGTDLPTMAKAFQDALSGNQDALKKYNVDLSDSALQAFANERGLQGMSREQLIYQKMLSDTTAAQGAYNSASNEGQKKQEQLNAEWENSKAKLGEALQPVLIQFNETLLKMIPIIQGVIKYIGWWVDNLSKLIDWIKTAIGWIDNITDKMGKLGGLLSPIKGIAGIVGGLFSSGPSVELGQTVRTYLYGDSTRTDGGSAPVTSINTLNPTFNFAISIDGEQLQGRINSTVNTALQYEGARLAAAGWY